MTTAAAEEGSTAKGRRAPVIWQMLVVMFAVLAAAIAISSAVSLATRFQGSGLLGDHEDGCDARGFCAVSAVDPDSPMERAGIRTGDTVRYDEPIDNFRQPYAGETVGFTLGRGTSERHMTVTSWQRPWTASDAAVRMISLPLTIAAVAIVLLAIFLAVRSRGRASTLLLATAFACNYDVFNSQAPPGWLSPRDIYVPVFILTAFANLLALLIFAAFARQFRREVTGGDGRLVRLAFYGLAIFTVAFVIYQVASQLGIWPWGSLTLVTQIGAVTVLVGGFVLAVVVLLLGRWDVAREQRGRFTLLMTAVILTAALRPIGYIEGLFDPGLTHEAMLPVTGSIMVLCATGGALLFAYTILRHRVIDIGFAVNQTLIYGVVSFVVLLAFGLAEWGIEKIMPHEWREHVEANAFISAGIALVIFLTFHRIRDFVEHVIEGIFFYKWRQNEAQLDRFLKKAAHIVKPDALMAAAVAEFARFSGGAEVALYRTEGTRLVRDAGGISGLDAALDIDLPALVAMRSDGKLLFAEDAEALHAALVLPMVQRNDLTGFIALGGTPSGDLYRPDERAVLAEAAQKIGLDLHALRIEELETESAAQKARADTLEAQMQKALAHPA